MKLVGDILTNSHNVFALIETDTLFQFDNEADMKSFMQYSFPDSGTNPDSAYCSQQPTQPKIFQCLIIYSSGLPNF